MVDEIISMVLDRLKPVIEEGVRDGANLLLYPGEEASNLASKLEDIQKLLGDAEKRRVIERRIKVWLEKIKDLAYEIEDALDEWEMKKLELKIEGSQDASKFCKKVSSFIQSLVLCSKYLIALKIKGLNGRLESIKKQNNDEFKLVPNLTVNSQKTVSHDELFKVKYQVDIKKELVSKLKSEGSQQENPIQIIAIVGTGGLGKTTVAQLAFNDPEVQNHFEPKIWVSASDSFDGTRIANAILERLTRNPPKFKELQRLLDYIKKRILGKRFILILDDVWSEDEVTWSKLKGCLNNGKPGSRILVTTRKKGVARMMFAQIQRLEPLSNCDCWSLMSQIAFRGGEKRHRETLETIGPEIAKKCAGLPLAAKALGTLLRETDTELHSKVLNDEVWTLDTARDKIFPHIHLSYKELEPEVKRCFTYCAIYPKKSEIKADTLIKMWMAQGFLSSATKKMEQRGREYLNDLAARSLFQDVKRDDLTGQIVSCKMHDIIHDFAQYVTKGECVTVPTENFVDEESRSIARHLLLRDRSALRDLFSNFGFENSKKLRSFITDPDPSFITDSDLFQWGTLKCVRVLNLSQCGLREVPSEEVAKLIHLRYLDLSGNHRIRELPISLCQLYNLQTLILDRCLGLSKLPEEIYKLINLRHLSFVGLHDPPHLPQGVEKLTCLKTLTCFKAKRGGSKLGYLKNLNQLEGFLKIMIRNLNEVSYATEAQNAELNLNEVSDATEAQNAELKNKTRLRTLELDVDGEVSMDVMEALQPPPNLYCLLLIGFGVEFPRWISTSLNNLKALNIKSCRSLPPLGNLQSLESLSIWDMHHTKYMGHEFLRTTDGGEAAFPRLKVLEFYCCDDWTEWEDKRDEEENVVSIMPCLSRLTVSSCRKLKSLPNCLLCKTPLEYFNISESNLLIEQCSSGKFNEFLRPMCKVVTN